MGNVYPVIEDPFDSDPHRSLRGKPPNLRYDAYFAAVEWTDQGPRPCRPREREKAGLPVHSELVVHQDHAILPRFILQLRRRPAAQDKTAAAALAEAKEAEAKEVAAAAEALAAAAAAVAAETLVAEAREEASKMSAEL